jgi:ATPase complex subunit ATP10
MHVGVVLVLIWHNQKALYFPDVVGKSLDTGESKHTTDMCAGRVSVISMLSTKISEVIFDIFHRMASTDAAKCRSITRKDSLSERFRSHLSYQFIQINLQENLLKSSLVSLFTSSIRATIPDRCI